MKCSKCGSEIPDVYAKCADCKRPTNQLDNGKKVYCGLCGGKRKAKDRAEAAAKAIKAKSDKAIKPSEDK